MITDAVKAQMMSYALENHGYRPVNLRISTNTNINHAVVSTDPYCGNLSCEGFTITSNSGQDAWGNRDNYSSSKLIIPLKRKYYSTILKCFAQIKYEATSNDANNGYREYAFGVHNFDNEQWNAEHPDETPKAVYTEFFRGYYSIPNTSNYGAITTVRDVINAAYTYLLNETSGSPANIGIELRVMMREGDVMRSVAFEIELVG